MNIRFLISVFILSIVSGCGFHLRGYTETNFQNQMISIVSQNDYSEFEKQFKTDLKLAGANIRNANTSDKASGDLWQVRIIALNVNHQSALRDAYGRANETIIQAELEYQISYLKAVPSMVQADEDFGVIKVSRQFYLDYRNSAAERVLYLQTRKDVIEALSSRLFRQLEFRMNQ